MLLAGGQSASDIFIPPAMLATGWIDRPAGFLPFMLQDAIVGWKRVGGEIGWLFVMARLAARIDTACRPSRIERMGSQSLSLLHDLRDVLQIPIFRIGHRRRVVSPDHGGFARDQREVTLYSFVRYDEGPPCNGDTTARAMIVIDHDRALGVGPQFGGMAMHRVASVIRDENIGFAGTVSKEHRLAAIAIAGRGTRNPACGDRHLKRLELLGKQPL
jgi:hypothetical protein